MRTYPLKRTWDQRYLPPPPVRDLGPEIPPPKQTNTFENITFPQLRWRAVKMCSYIHNVKLGRWQTETIEKSRLPDFIIVSHHECLLVTNSVP